VIVSVSYELLNAEFGRLKTLYLHLATRKLREEGGPHVTDGQLSYRAPYPQEDTLL
jgi:hypothetical protein